ncbi:MAG TPA: peptide chain release factor N(5)-glutamine methyltransferase [Gemmatimonadales bacterium]|nr:peptide chain release factor N(5)-glutamine methyltransferase [Gemmatimonadales bacterium]
MPDVAVSLAQLLAEATERLAAAGVPEPRREALWLWADPRGIAPARAWLERDRAVEPAEADAFLDRVARRAAGEPRAYVTGSAGFRRLALRSDRRALIPRPETEGLVELALECAPSGRIADIGTGTGCIALSLALEGRYDQVVALDSSPAALSLAAENHAAARAAADGVAMAPVSLVRGDLTAPLAAGSLDALVSNPPYLTMAEWEALDPGVKAWEPAEALASGADGLDAVRALLDDGRRVLRAGGWVALEVDCTRARASAELAQRAGWREVTVRMDLFGRERYLLARRSEDS